MLILYLLNLAVIASSILITKAFYSRHGTEDKLLAAFTVYLGQIILFVLLLGITGVFTLSNLVILALAFSLVVFFLLRDKKGLPFFTYPGFEEAFLWISRNKLLAISVSFLLGFSLVKIFHNLIMPPFLWDNLIYHYTFPVEWIKNGNLANPIVFTCPGLSYIAMNGEYFFLWLMVPLKNVFIADITCYPFYIAGVIASFGIMRKLGVRKEIALLSGILFSLTPQYFKDLLFNSNNLMVAPLFLIALNFVLLLKEEFSFRNVVIAGVSIGLLWGAKSTAMIWAPLLAPMAIYFMIREYRKNKGFSKFILLALIFIILVVIFGGFTYIRNFIETGNPFYPVNYKLLGMNLKGPIEFSEIYDGINLFNVDLGEMLFHQSFGLHFIFLAFPALFLSLPLLLIKSRFRLPFDILYLLVLPLIMVMYFYAKCPTHTPGYLYHIIALGTIISVYTLGRLGLKEKVIKVILFIMIIGAVAELAGHMMLFWSLVLSGLIFVALISVKNAGAYGFYRIFSIICIFILLGGLVPLEDYYKKTECKRYASTIRWEKDLALGWEWIYEHTLHNPKNIAYTGSSAIFPLYGKDFANNVYYTSVNDKEPDLRNFSKAHEFRNPREWVRLMRQDCALREKADFDIWLQNLYRKDTDLLFIMSLDFADFFPVEDEWARRHPRIFKRVLLNKRVRIYKILGKHPR